MPNFYAASASPPTGLIYLFDKSNLQNVQTLPGHETAITSLRTINTLAGLSRPFLASSGKDGAVKIWDERSGNVSMKMTSAGRPRSLLCFDVSADGLTVAAGTDFQGEDALILYWDPRNPSAPVRTHGSTHSDDITVLHFLHSSSSHPSSSESKILLSGSSDGLISTSNADEENEDEAVLHVGNWGCSVSQAGWISVSAGAQAWAGSDMETFSCWTDELDMLQTQDIRQPSLRNPDRTWVTDYLIGCHNSTQPGSSGLGVFVGSNEGDVALITTSNLSSSTAPWSVNGLWTNGHIGVVRSLLWDEPVGRFHSISATLQLIPLNIEQRSHYRGRRLKNKYMA
jgi:WD40 repeat protein